ncbi:hypothetical protein [Paenibacillus xylanexedens]|uniref:hypothetical protein n=1 Tax=Paenibacillus xylanexedens TaxID=528191 RepID=UPI000F51D1B2|nr:hypothetical protein [Paenibacillus xylanexedens]RPK29966.1 hypothetical protein EDO6_00591 [Paenibacillus xylanexedens]
MRALTADEKKKIAEAKKRANSAITRKKIMLGAQIRACTAPSQTAQKKDLVRHFDSLSPIKGYPAIIEDKERSMVIDYELFRRLTRSLNHRRVDIRIEPGGVLTIHHEDPSNGRNHGEMELYEIPPWQQCALTDLPVIEID